VTGWQLGIGRHLWRPLTRLNASYTSQFISAMRHWSSRSSACHISSEQCDRSHACMHTPQLVQSMHQTKSAPVQVCRLPGVRRCHYAFNLDTSHASRSHRYAQAQVLLHHVSTGREQARSGTCTLSARAQEHRSLQGIRWAARVWQGRQAKNLSWRRRAAGLAYLPLVQLVLTLQHPKKHPYKLHFGTQDTLGNIYM
jgi:hypothetical protein